MGELTAVVLAGGEGTRLRPLTRDLPKAMLPVLNRPFLEHLLTRLQAGGVQRVILALGYRADPLIRYFGTGATLGLRLDYVVEERPLGTSGAVRALLPELRDTTLVLNGDCLADLEIARMVQEHGERREFATIAVHAVPDPSRYGLVLTDGEGYVTQFVEKPRGPRFPAFTVNTGVYALEPEALRMVPEGFSMFERDLFPAMLSRGMQIHTYPWQGYFCDMGTPGSYLALHRDMLEGRLPGAFAPGPEEVSYGRDVTVHPTASIKGPALLGDGVRLAARARVVGPAVLGAGCVLEEGAVVEGSVLWEGVRVWRDARVHGAVLGSGVRVEPGATLLEGAVVASGETVPSDTHLGPAGG